MTTQSHFRTVTRRPRRLEHSFHDGGQREGHLLRSALKRGLAAGKHAVLDIECPAEHKTVTAAAIDEFRPQTLFALRLVEELDGLAILHNAYLNHKVNDVAGLVVNETGPLTSAADDADELAALIRGLISSSGSASAFDLLRRYTATLQNQYNCMFAQVQKLEDRARRRRDRDFNPTLLPPYRSQSSPRLPWERRPPDRNRHPKPGSQAVQRRHDKSPAREHCQPLPQTPASHRPQKPLQHVSRIGVQ